MTERTEWPIKTFDESYFNLARISASRIISSLAAHVDGDIDRQTLLEALDVVAARTTATEALLLTAGTVIRDSYDTCLMPPACRPGSSGAAARIISERIAMICSKQALFFCWLAITCKSSSPMPVLCGCSTCGWVSGVWRGAPSDVCTSVTRSLRACCCARLLSTRPPRSGEVNYIDQSNVMKPVTACAVCAM